MCAYFCCSFCVIVSFCFFFFSSRRRHTRSLCDWSSDVCSSDLGGNWSYEAWFVAAVISWVLLAHALGVRPDWRFLLLSAATLLVWLGYGFDSNRSEERRVGKEWKVQGRTDQSKKTTTEQVN